MSWLLPIWQILPVNPDWQLHSKPSPVSVQIPPFLQGLPLQCELSVKRQNQKLNSRKINFPAVQLFDWKKTKTEDNRNFTLKISHLIGTIFLSMALDIYRHNRSQDQDNFHCSNKDWSCIHWYLPRERKPKTALRECLFHQNFIGLLQNHLQLKT